MHVRLRLYVAVPATVVFTVLGTRVATPVWEQWWFFVGLATVIAAVFVEPYFSRPQDGMMNAIGGLGAFGTANRTGVEALWWIYFGVALTALFGGAIATVTSPSRAPRVRTLANWAARQLGRAVVLGPAALAIESLRLGVSGQKGYAALAAGALVLVFALGPNWERLLLSIRGAAGGGSAQAVTAVGPRLLLVSSLNRDPLPGSTYNLKGPVGEALGTLIGSFPHADGLRYKYLLDRPWHDVVARFPADLVTTAVPGGGPLGAASEGSTETSIRFEPASAVEVGQSVRIGDALFQITAVELTRSTWDGGASLVRSAHARLIGSPEGDRLIVRPRLPEPHEPVLAPGGGASLVLPAGYVRLGVVKGTALPIGLRQDHVRRSHLAILGMSGMGKTATAHRVAGAMALDSAVVALDVTGEYQAKLAVTAYTPPFGGVGFTVHEPTGEPPAKARQFIEETMTIATTEYQAGQCSPRVVVLEEAHSFVPEWNFTGRNMQDQVNMTARYIMQARKYALAFVVVSQRTAVVSKSVLSQCENYICLRTIDETSLGYMEAIVGPELRQALPALKRYEALCVGPDFNAEGPVVVSLDAP